MQYHHIPCPCLLVQMLLKSLANLAPGGLGIGQGQDIGGGKPKPTAEQFLL
jgi:hypothetical protein